MLVKVFSPPPAAALCGPPPTGICARLSRANPPPRGGGGGAGGRALRVSLENRLSPQNPHQPKHCICSIFTNNKVILTPYF